MRKTPVCKARGVRHPTQARSSAACAVMKLLPCDEERAYCCAGGFFMRHMACDWWHRSRPQVSRLPTRAHFGVDLIHSCLAAGA